MTSGTNSKVLVIERARWRRGGGGKTDQGYTAMLNEQGFMCCLGFDAVACGVPPAQLLNRFYPMSIPRLYGPADAVLRVVAPVAPGVWHTDAPAVDEAVIANDLQGVTEVQREMAVATALCKLGWDEVQFV